MKERPILFSGEMARAILEGRKTQTRRAVKPQPGDHMRIPMLTQNGWQFMTHPDQLRDTISSWRCPFGIPGDRLWVRETWAEFAGIEPKSEIVYRADGTFDTPAKEHLRNKSWRPAIFMPRCASRIALEITAIRVELLQDISEDDAIAEGCTHTGIGRSIAADEIETAREQFQRLWESIYGEESWNANPWVWVIEFKKI